MLLYEVLGPLYASGLKPTCCCDGVGGKAYCWGLYATWVGDVAAGTDEVYWYW